MKLPKFVLSIVVITSFSLLYVYQQTEIFCLAYISQKKQISLEDLLDKNNLLRYNINRNASLVNIGSRISEDADFQMPDNFKLIRMAPAFEESKPQIESSKVQILLTHIFGIKRQAEAKTVNP